MNRVLIVIDMQNDFVDGALGTKEAVAILDGVADKIRNFSGDIFVTYDTHTEDYLSTSEGKKLPVAHCIKGTHGWELCPSVTEALKGRSYTAVEKPTFGSTALPELLLKKYGTEPFEVTLIGLCTDICVISNALLLKAHFPEYKIGVDPACCAGVTPASHDAALTAMRMCQIEGA